MYSGLLRFTCSPDGAHMAKSHDLHVTSEMTCGDVIPVLCRHLSPHLNGTADFPGENSGHISLVQGESKYTSSCMTFCKIELHSCISPAMNLYD